jgi:hypothetical protein
MKARVSTLIRILLVGALLMTTLALSGHTATAALDKHGFLGK